jgi:hypothetical protein
MLRTVVAAATALTCLVAMPMSAIAGGLSPAQLTKAGWTCILPPPEFNPNVHCLPSDQLAAVVSGEARVVISLAFATDDLGATEAPLLGTERMIRADVFAGQPCPTDPPSLGYSWLYPRFGWDYYICHTFDSPW